MENSKKYLKLASMLLLVAVAALIVSAVFTANAGIDKDAGWYQDMLKQGEEQGINPEHMELALYVIILGVFGIQAVLTLILCIMGLRVVRRESSGIGHMVLEFILSVMAFSGLYDSIANFSAAASTTFAVVDVTVAVIWLATLLFFDWHSIQLRHALKAEAAKNML